MLPNERETLRLLNWPSKPITVTNWFSGGVQTGIIVAGDINEYKYIKQTSYYMYHKIPCFKEPVWNLQLSLR